VLRRLERAYGRDGIPALIVENAAIPAIETEANTILGELGTPYTVQLRTQRATAKGDLREALDIVVADGTGEAAYEDFSGGERTRINLALRLALSRLLAHRRGAEVGLLVLDEPDYLDDEGMERLIGVLRRLEHDFGRVYLISHVPVLREAFDQVLQVEKVDGRSRLAGVREAVAA
jgi:exonuclease SbcC